MLFYFIIENYSVSLLIDIRYFGISHDINERFVTLNTTSNIDIWNRKTFYTEPVKSIYKNTKLLLYLIPKIWELFPENIKPTDSLIAFIVPVK